MVTLTKPDNDSLQQRAIHERLLRFYIRELDRVYDRHRITRVRFQLSGHGNLDWNMKSIHYWNDQNQKVSPDRTERIPYIVRSVDDDYRGIPRATYQDLGYVEEEVIYILFSLCGLATQWAFSGGISVIEWDLKTGLFSVDMAEFAYVIGPNKTYTYQNGTVMHEGRDVTRSIDCRTTILGTGRF